MNILLYLVKASACTLAFYTIYYLFLKRLTFFGLNRWYLIATMVLSFVIPAIHFSVSQKTSGSADVVTDEHINTSIATVVNADTNSPKIYTVLTLPQMLLYAYLLVALVLGVKLCIGIVKLLVLGYRQGVSQYRCTVVKQTATQYNSSFFHIIFLKNTLNTKEEEVIVMHEKEHIKRLHSLDIMMMEIAKVLLWFNPVPYLYKQAIEQVHEYQADASVTDRYNRKYYVDMLLKLSGFNAPLLVNNFSDNQLYKRVDMLFANRSKQVKKGLYVFAAPIFAVLIWYLCVDRVYAQKLLPASKFTVVIDAGHGGKNTGAVVNGINEKNIVLDVAKAVETAGEASGVNIILTRTGDESLSYEKRVSNKADLFITLHANSGNNTLNGISAITASNSGNTSSALLAASCLAELGKLKGIAVSPVVKEQRIKVLELCPIPATLFELGCMTNASDLRFIINPNKQAEIAAAIVSGITQFRDKIKTVSLNKTAK